MWFCLLYSVVIGGGGPQTFCDGRKLLRHIKKESTKLKTSHKKLFKDIKICSNILSSNIVFCSYQLFRLVPTSNCHVKKII